MGQKGPYPVQNTGRGGAVIAHESPILYLCAMIIRSRAVFIWFKLGRAGLRSITGPYTAKSGLKCDRAAQSE